jgi:hypothetical protein
MIGPIIGIGSTAARLAVKAAFLGVLVAIDLVARVRRATR